MTIVGRSLTLFTAAVVSMTASASYAGDAVVDQARRARGGAGLRVGSWQVAGLTTAPSGEASETPAFEGWFQKGFDLHIAMENTIGFWQRKESSFQPGSFGPETTVENESYLVPTLTSLKLYPMTTPASRVEPYLSAGVGVVLGFFTGNVSGSDPTLVPSEGSKINTGLGIQTGGGIDLNSGGMFGLTMGGRYQWASFRQDEGGSLRLYKGPSMNIGLTYRFRYE